MNVKIGHTHKKSDATADTVSLIESKCNQRRFDYLLETI